MKIRPFFTLFLLLLLSVSGWAAPTYNMYMRLGTIQGNVSDKDHRDWIEVVAIKGLNRLTESGPIVIKKYQDDASTPIFANCTAGNLLPDAIIEVYRPVTSGAPMMVVGRLTLGKVTIKEANIVHDKTVDVANPLEEITLAYETIQWETIQYNADGSKKATLKDTWNNGTKAKT